MSTKIHLLTIIPFLLLTVVIHGSLMATGVALPEPSQETAQTTFSDDEMIEAYNLSGDFFYTYHQGKQDDIGRCWVFANDTKKVQVLTLTVPGRFQDLETITIVIKPGELVSFNRKPRFWINASGIQFSYQYIAGAQICDRNSIHTTTNPNQIAKLNTYISQHLDDTQGSIEQKYAHLAAIHIKDDQDLAHLQNMGTIDDNEIVRFGGQAHLWLPTKLVPKKTMLARLEKTALQTAKLFSFGDKLSLAINSITTIVTSGIPFGVFRLGLLGAPPAISHVLGTQDPMIMLTTLRTILEKKQPLRNSTAALIVRCINIIESSTGQTYKDKQKHVVQILREKLQSVQNPMQETPPLQNPYHIAYQLPLHSDFDWHQATVKGAGRCWAFSNNTTSPQTLLLQVPHRLYGSEEISITIAPGQLVSFNRKPYIVPFSDLGLHTYVLGSTLKQTALALSEVKKLNEYIAHHLDDTRGSRENPQASESAISIEDSFSLHSRQNTLDRTIEENELAQFNNGYYLFLPIKTVQRRSLHDHINPLLQTAKEVAFPLGYAVWKCSLSPIWYASGKFVDLFMSFSGNQNSDQALQKLTELLQDIEVTSRPQRRRINHWLHYHIHNTPSPTETLTLKEKKQAQQSIYAWLTSAETNPLHQTDPALFKSAMEYAHAAIAGLH